MGNLCVLALRVNEKLSSIKTCSSIVAITVAIPSQNSFQMQNLLSREPVDPIPTPV
jgi:hypothetical protein